MKAAKGGAALVAATALAYLGFWPVKIAPVAWQPLPAAAGHEPPPPRAGLEKVERLANGERLGPEYVEIDAKGNMFAGYVGGDVVRMSADGKDGIVVANTGGRPLGMRALRDGSLIVADALKGLLRVSAKGEITVLTDAFEGERFGFPDDVAVTADERTAYFTDASRHFGIDDFVSDIIEHGGRGRLFRYDFAEKTTTLLLSGVNFANGVALGPRDEFLVLVESGSYLLRRIWLEGARAGKDEIFAAGLPGFPDNVTFDAEDGLFWVALENPRNHLLDLLSGWPFLRKVVARLPELVRPSPVSEAHLVALSLDGRPVLVMSDVKKTAYAPITTVRAHGPYLYLGSLAERAIGRLPRDEIRRDKL